MPKRISSSGSELFIFDNCHNDWRVVKFLQDCCQISKSIDIATGHFEIGSLLALEKEWQKVDQIRILVGKEFSDITKKEFSKGLLKIKSPLDQSIDVEKESLSFSSGIPAILKAVESGKINFRVHRKNRFHAKTYIAHSRNAADGSSALIGSSNFIYHGLTENIELNVQVTGEPVKFLQEWYEEHWKNAEDIAPEILKTEGPLGFLRKLNRKINGWRKGL